MEEQTKRCTTCDEYKCISEYNKQNKGKCGVKSQCRQCQAKHNVAKRLEHRDLVPPESKRCSKCKEIKLAKEFYKDQRSDTGLSSQCKLCFSNYTDAKGFVFSGNRDTYLKRCTKCNKRKSAKEFYNHSYSPDGLDWQCKSCVEDYQEEHREEIKVQQAIYYEEHREEKAIYRAEYYIENLDKLLSYAAEYYKEHKEENAARSKAWRKDNPEKTRINNQKRRAQKEELPSDLTDTEWEFIKEYYSSRCAYCGKSERELQYRLTQDHVIPQSRGGGYTATNIVPACKPCNSHKHNRLLEETDMSLIKPQPIVQLSLRNLTRKE